MEIVKVAYLGSDGQYQTYMPSDLSLINKTNIVVNFGNPNDYIEYFIKDQANEILSSNYYDTNYKIGSVIDPVTNTTNTLYIDPEADARRSGYNRGIVNLKYNFFRKYLLSTPDPSQNFWIKEISTSRTEIKAARQDLSNGQLQQTFNDFSNALAADAYFPDFYLNFGADIQLIAVNAVYVEEGGIGYIIFKLYEELPAEFDVKSTFWVVDNIADPAEFNVSIEVEPETILDSTPIRGPNYKVAVNDAVAQTTEYYNYADLFITSVTSSYQQLQSMMDEKGIQINVDYTNFSNFIHFSSATERIYNFVYKIQLIESASAGLATNNTTSARIALQSTIDSIITKFDGYEYYLYFTSASAAWPKQTTTQPFELYSVTSSAVVDWLGSPSIYPTSTAMSMYYSSSLYDDNNKDLLNYATPAYLLDDSGNQPYLVFLNMIGQHFDNIWIYLKDVTNRYSAENNPFVGISMDQVADAIRNVGVKLYTNTSISNNIYYSMLGINPDGSLLPPTGSEVITNYVTSSIATLPNAQITGEIYKRLYHNLAYLLKTRGTERGVRALITTYGIPHDILQVHEYGGYDIYTTPGIQELALNKIITSSNTPQIESDLLSPFATLQYYNNDMMKSSGDLEIGFSPADSINASITSSGYITSSTQPGYFNIMQLIGDPQLQYSSSYTPLVNLGDTYFNAEYTSRYNVWDFIRIIKYYNNSVFKMLRDWVPARSSTSTGIIIKSHMLERNKYPRHEPTYTTSSYEADYLMVTVSGSDGGSVIGSTAYTQAIPIQYNGAISSNFTQSLGTVFMDSTDGVQRFNGEFEGTTIQASYNNFSQEYISSYTSPWTSSVPGNGPLFLTYSLSPLYENVTEAVLSQRFLDLDYGYTQNAPTNYGLITKSIDETIAIGSVIQSQQPYSQYARLQDYNYNVRRSVYPRYSGSYMSSQFYNRYTTGDTSYGNDPVINYNTIQLGLFTQLTTSSFFPGKVDATLAYLANVSGGLFELNQENTHWVDVQNIFKQSKFTTVKQWDNQKYSNQRRTDGSKFIYESGYRYSPMLYFASGSDNRIYFNYLGTGETLVLAQNQPAPNNLISGSGTITYPVVLTGPANSGSIYNIFDIVTQDGGANYSPGTSLAFPTYSVPHAGTYNVSLKMLVSASISSSAESASYTVNIKHNGVVVVSGSGVISSVPLPGGDGFYIAWGFVP